eukprot:2697250-Ditylum_brightwellii.AAC.1
MALLSIDDALRTEGLASICYRRTLGNPFFLLEFVKLLEEEGLLSFHLGLLQWEWDETDVESRTASTENVVDLLQGKMEKLSTEARGFLQCAACLGASFVAETIHIVWHDKRMSYMDSSTVESSTEELLTTMVKENYLESPKNNEYRWTHDNVQQAASSLIEEESRASFRHSIGEVLYKELSVNVLDTYLFEVANLLNTATAGVTNIDYAKINLTAAEKARNVSAFEKCSDYASKGIRMLRNDTWTSHPEMTVKLYSLAAEAE